MKAFSKLGLFVAVFGVLSAQAIDWQSMHERIRNTCNAQDAACVGHVMLDAMEQQGSSGTGFVYKDISCVCNGSYDLQCTVGTGSNEVTIQGNVSIGLGDFCEQNRKLVRVRGRVCNGSYDLVRVDLKNFKFVNELSVGLKDRCIAAAQGN